MHRRSLARACFTIAGAALLALAASTVAAQTLDEVLAKHYAARGGLDKMKAATTYTMTGKMLMGEMQAPFTVRMKRPNMFRADFTVMGMTGTQAFDGTHGWSVMPFMGKKDPEPMPGDAEKEVKQRADFDGPLVDWKAKGETVELLGKEKMEGTDAWKIKVTMPDSSTNVIYLDADAYLEIKSEGKRTMNGNDVEIEEYASDYKDVNGLILPMTMETKVKGMTETQKMVIDSVAVDVPMPDDAFAMPAIVKATDAQAGAPAAKPEAKEVKTAPVPTDKKTGKKPGGSTP